MVEWSDEFVPVLIGYKSHQWSDSAEGGLHPYTIASNLRQRLKRLLVHKALFDELTVIDIQCAMLITLLRFRNVNRVQANAPTLRISQAVRDQGVPSHAHLVYEEVSGIHYMIQIRVLHDTDVTPSVADIEPLASELVHEVRSHTDIRFQAGSILPDKLVRRFAMIVLWDHEKRIPTIRLYNSSGLVKSIDTDGDDGFASPDSAIDHVVRCLPLASDEDLRQIASLVAGELSKRAVDEPSARVLESEES